ncbi:formate dehydrogenase subunit alpha [Natronocalculus amylovorans]|uniref:Formate dehydrogenase subunit alpha n=1 Tax=Natronocalculus amylovorans TaxID=2917812 RepID=A0AAE3G038_9EURY|nr:formate dehydrogenase subunit alpha [Natronocalculus amylovorans]MCL9818045.1 formate dehydrogenase subunit alpha [Natronocalculus amylovorans]
MSNFDRPLTETTSICPYCGVGCGLTVNKETHKAGGWKAPVNKRGEICPKGAAAFEMVTDEGRLTTPLAKDGDSFVPISWDDAFDRIESEFSAIFNEHGPTALSFFASSNCSNEENYVLGKLARSLGTNNIDNCARLCHSATVAAMRDRFGTGAMTNSLEDLTESDVYLIVGANPAVNHPIIFRSYLLPAIRKGTKVIHIDPRETDTTRPATHHLPVKPGYDIPLLTAIAATIVQEGLHDTSFIDARLHNVDDELAWLRAVDIDEHASLAGVDPEPVRSAARLYARADRAAIFTGMGMSQHHCGTANVHALLNLPLLTGHIGKPGTGINPLRGQNNVQGASDMGTLPDTLPGYGSVASEADRDRLEAVWGFEPPTEPGLTEVEATHAFGDTVHGAYIFGENPAVTEPNASVVRERLDSIDFLVVHDLFETETAAYADIILPGSAWAEREGTVTNTDRQVQRMHALTEPPGDAKPDLEILCELAERLSAHSFRYDSTEEVFTEITEAVPQYSGMSYDKLATGSQRWPIAHGDAAGTAVLLREQFQTTDGKASIRHVEHVPPADELGEGQLVLTTGRVIEHFNSGALTRRSGILTKMRASDELQINPVDAAARTIKDGDTVTVSNDRGSVTVTASVTPAIQEGTVFMTFHFADPLVNTLTGDELDPVAKIPEYKHSAVTVS